MKLTIEEQAGRQLVRLSGELDTFSARGFREKLSLLRPSDRYVVDLAGLSFVDSAGLHALFAVGRNARDVGAAVVFVVPVESPVRRVIELVQLGDVSPVCDSFNAALGRLPAPEGFAGEGAG